MRLTDNTFQSSASLPITTTNRQSRPSFEAEQMEALRLAGFDSSPFTQLVVIDHIPQHTDVIHSVMQAVAPGSIRPIAQIVPSLLDQMHDADFVLSLNPLETALNIAKKELQEQITLARKNPDKKYIVNLSIGSPPTILASAYANTLMLPFKTDGNTDAEILETLKANWPLYQKFLPADLKLQDCLEPTLEQVQEIKAFKANSEAYDSWATELMEKVMPEMIKNSDTNPVVIAYRALLEEAPDNIMFLRAAGNYGPEYASLEVDAVGNAPNVISIGGAADQGEAQSINPLKNSLYNATSGSVLGRISITADAVDVLGKEGVTGTSYATPLVGGFIAQLWDAFPDLTAAQVKQLLESTAYNDPDLPDDREGHGRLQPNAAWEAAQELTGKEPLKR